MESKMRVYTCPMQITLK